MESVLARVFLGLFIVVYFFLIAYVWHEKHPHRKLITFLMLLGPIGIAISIMVLLARRTVEPKVGDSDAHQCPNCLQPYRLQDYRSDATIVCSVCKKEIPRPVVI